MITASPRNAQGRLHVALAFSLAFLLLVGTSSRATDAPPVRSVYVGSYSTAEKAGLHQLELDLATGDLRDKAETSGLANPSFLAFHPSRRFLYAVSEVSDYEGQKTGAVAAFAVDPKTGALRLLNRQASGGDGPCYITIAPSGRYAYVANYGGGTVAVLPIEADGALAPAISVVRHQGSGADPSRQEGPHAHSIDLDGPGRFALAADLGLDKVLVYAVAEKGSLTPHDPPSAALPPGSGPRHLAFGKRGAFAYVINELSSTVEAFAYDAALGTLKSTQTITTLPVGFKGKSYAAEIAVSGDGRFLYGSNRGHDSIASFAIDPATGRLRATSHTPTGGSWPRHFAIDPSGTFLLAANQKSNSVVVFRIDRRTGALTPTGHRITVPEPACVVFR
jgi:6-phosphogluconolactonase